MRTCLRVSPNFTDFSILKLEADECPEYLFQRLLAFVEDNLLGEDGGVKHHNENLTEDKELSLHNSFDNFIVLTWLRLNHQNLHNLVNQRYGTELSTRTIASIKPEISQTLNSFVEELRSSKEARVMRTAAASAIGNINRFSKSKPQSRRPNTQKTCPLCHQAGRHDYNHFVRGCPHLHNSNRKFMTCARQIICLEKEDGPEYDDTLSVFSYTDSIPSHNI